MESNKISIEIIGSAGAFDFGKTSASFLIKVGDENVLVDCGHNVLKTLKEKGYMTVSMPIKTVFITHLHMDHVADLEGLIYYNYFILGIRTSIFIPYDLRKDFYNMFPEYKFNTEYLNGVNNSINCMYHVKNSPIISSTPAALLELIPFKANHGNVDAYGYYLTNTRLSKDRIYFIISGDSKANYNLLNIAEKEIVKNYDVFKTREKLHIFHDFSEWDDVTKNIHCCNTDFKLVYNSLINGENKDIVKFIKYHNGDNVGFKQEFLI